MKSKNIYTFSIEKAIENGNKISFNELKKELEKKYNSPSEIELYNSGYFKIWFYSNFYQESVYLISQNKDWVAIQNYIIDENASQYNNQKTINNDEECFLAYNAFDYYESYKKNKINNRKSSWAIAISITSVIISAVLLVANLVKMFLLSNPC